MTGDTASSAAPLSAGALREALVSALDQGGAWGQNMHESKKVLLRTGGGTYPLTRVSVSFTGGEFTLILDGGGHGVLPASASPG